MTTLFDDITRVYLSVDEIGSRADEALERLIAIADQFKALTPDWAEAPEWAQWYAIDCHNAGFWFDAPQPLITYDNETYDAPTWANNSLCKFAAHIGLLPFGIDWRLCKWQRPTVQP